MRQRSQLKQAKATLAADEAASAPAEQISQDKAAVTNATQNLAQAKAKATQSNNQSAESVASAELQVTSAEQGYESKTAPAPALTILTDEASVATAQAAVATAQTTVNLAQITAPADGTVTAVSIVAGLDAPSGDAIEMEGEPDADHRELRGDGPAQPQGRPGGRRSRSPPRTRPRPAS